MKKTVNHVFFWVYIYNVIVFACGLLSGVVPMGLESVIAVVVGNALIILLGCRKQWGITDVANKTMTGKDFISILCLCCLCQGIQAVFSVALASLNVEGASIGINIASLGIWFILYAGLIGPVAEELVYRRFIIGSLRKYGMIPALVVSAIAFGLMHANLTQGVFAAITGFVFGFVYLEYGLLWTCVFHIINNFGFATLPALLFGDSEVVNVILIVLIALGSVAGIVILIRRRSEIQSWFEQPGVHGENGCAKHILTSAWFWVFSLMYVLIIIALLLNPDAAASISASLGAG